MSRSRKLLELALAMHHKNENNNYNKENTSNNVSAILNTSTDAECTAASAECFRNDIQTERKTTNNYNNDYPSNLSNCIIFENV